MTVGSLLLILLSVGLSSAAQIAMKAGLSSPASAAALGVGAHWAILAAALLNPLVLFGFALYFVGALVWLIVLSRIDVSLAYPFVSLGFLLTAGLASVLLGEQVGAARLIGIVMVAAGVLIVARS